MGVRTGLRSAALLVVLALCLPAGARQDDAKSTKTTTKSTKSTKSAKIKARSAEAAELPAVLMEDRGDPASLNLFYGVGSKEEAPDPEMSYKFIAEDLKQTSPKFDVEDAQGVRWRVKLGSEARAETAATRLVWALGYFVDEDYYIDTLKVKDLPKLKRGEKYAPGDGTVRGVRLERKDKKDVKELGKWNWFSNPFVHTKELNGLRVVMALINNWDLVTKNNSIYEVDGQRRYVVSDIGASFGHTGNYLSGSKDDLEGYEKSKFITKIDSDTVDLEMLGRPLPLTIVEAPYNLGRPGAREVARHIPRADAKWIGQKLGQLSESQIRDCFRAAGYSPAEVDGFTKVVQERIAALTAL